MQNPKTDFLAAVFKQDLKKQATFIEFAGWIGLTVLVNIYRNKINLRKLWWINKITGVVVAIFGIGIIVSAIFIKKIMI